MDKRTLYYSNLNNFYKERSGLNVSQFSCVPATVKPMSQFKNFEDLKLPFIISGRLVSVGDYTDNNFGEVYLSKQELKRPMNEWVGISIYTSHDVYDRVRRGQDVSINEVVGKIINVDWNEEEQGIDFTAEIVDKQVAYKMAHGLIRFISVGFSRDVVRKGKRYEFVNLEPKEASLVFDPRDKKAEFRPVSA